MAYTVLARRYRSATFDEVVGQNHVAQTLKRAIESGRIAHAYLFCGTRGVGKTSMARILAKALNCLNAEGPTATPCLECAACKAIATGEDIDVMEIDAASHTGVDDVRDVIIGTARNYPAHARFKIFIIDEVHMLSKNAFNALLKTLEEPPEHVKFILATTETEKILPTILSRCQRYDFRNIPTREIAGHLQEIVRSEKIQADDDALLMVARAGAGSMRDSLSLLDRVLSLGQKQITVESIQELLGLPKAQLIYDLAQAIGEGRVKDVLAQSDQMITEGMAVDSLLTWLSEHFRNLLVIRTCGMDSGLVEIPGLSPAQLRKQAEQFDPLVLTQNITIVEELKRQLRSTAAGRALLDATLVRLAMAEQFASVADLLARVDGGGAAPAAQKKKPEVAESSGFRVQGSGLGVRGSRQTVAAGGDATDDARQAVREALVPSHDASTLSPGTPGEGRGEGLSTIADDDDLPRPGKVWDSSGPSLAELLKQHTAASVADDSTPSPGIPGEGRGEGMAAPPSIRAALAADPIEGAAAEAAPAREAAPSADASNVHPLSPADLDNLWPMLLSALAEQQGGAMVSSVLSMTQFLGVHDGQAVIRFPAHGETYARTWDKNGKKETIRKVLSSLANQDLGVRFEVETGDLPSPPTPSAPVIAPAPPRVATPAAARPVAPPNLAAPPPPQRLTPDQINEFRQDPLIAALMNELGGQVLKLADE